MVDAPPPTLPVTALAVEDARPRVLGARDEDGPPHSRPPRPVEAEDSLVRTIEGVSAGDELGPEQTTSLEAVRCNGRAGTAGGVSTIAFSPDGRSFVDSDNGVLRRYVLDTDELISQARGLLTRDLTADECRQYDVQCQ